MSVTVTKSGRRIPYMYDGTRITTRQVSDVMEDVLAGIRESYRDRPDLILAAWPEVIGSQLAAMTQAISFVEGVLLVKVKNSTLYSLLSQHDKPKILSRLRQKFPHTNIANIMFRMG